MCRINLSDVARPLVEFMLRDKAPARRIAIGHPELDSFEGRLRAAGDRCPCHVSLASTLEEWLQWAV